ncbi:MAG: DUF2799 domain-containing protein [Pseudomonadales bacterium]
MRPILLAGVLAGTLALAGCASTLTESQCLASDWQTVGYRDGIAGVQSSQLLNHQNACVKHGVVPDRNAYLAGWREGVYQYCQPGNGFAVGERGAGYANVCPAELEDAFQAAYREGRQLYVAQSEINQIYAGISQREGRIQSIKQELASITAAMISPESTAADRAAMLLTAKDLAEEQGRLEEEIQSLKAEVAYKSEELRALRTSLASVDY